MDVIRQFTARSRTLTLPFRLLFLLLLAQTAWADPLPDPGVSLARIYKEGVDLDQYWVSEKLDGVRAYWDGRQLLSRRGNVYVAPAWFTAGFPRTPLDGELWIGRNTFEQLVGIVRHQKPDDEGWHKVRYMVFDLPASGLTFTGRLAELRRLFGGLESPYIQLVEQFRLPGHQTLMERLGETVDAGGEGLMLHLASSLYRAGRSGDLLKVKPYFDAEARVIAHLPGRGKFTGMLGALLVETPEGRRFRIGTGFSDKERKDPPAIGAMVTYKYHGLTKNSLPRFAAFLRIREQPR